MEAQNKHIFRKTRILCMLEKTGISRESITSLARAGMNIACLDLSDGEKEENRKRISLIHEVSKTTGIYLGTAVMIRTAEVRQEKGTEDILFACRNDADFIILEDCRIARDIVYVRNLLKQEDKGRIRLIAGISSKEGIECYDSILEACDGIFLNRDSLENEMEAHLISLKQKELIRLANEAAKPIIAGIQMTLASLSILRAGDLVNLVSYGCDGVLMMSESEEDNLAEACEEISRIAEEAEKHLPYRLYAERAGQITHRSIQEAIGIAVSDAALELENAGAIVVFTQNGNIARQISRFRPCVPVIAVTFTRSTQRKLAGCWGVIPVYSEVQNSMRNDDDLACSFAKQYGISRGQMIILCAGYPTGTGSANMMKIISVK